MADGEKKKRKNQGANLKFDQMNTPTTKPEVYDLIGKRLRVYFEEVSSQPVPDRFMELLSQLEAKAPAKKLD
jgi:Anti-sigma factor NepR